MIRKFLFLLTISILGISSSAYAEGGRTVTDFDKGWMFHLGDAPKAQNPGFNDRTWRKLDLPHDWSIELDVDENAQGGGSVGYYPGGTGWYRKTFDMPGYSADKLYSINFDGVYMRSEVWINGHYLGLWPYGYTAFSYDLTPYIKSKGNVISVKVDNHQPNSRWYTGSGIYRHVTLTETSRFHFDEWGVFVSTVSIEDGIAVVRIDSDIVTDGKTYDKAIVRNVLYDASGKEVASSEDQILTGKSEKSVMYSTLKVKDAILWDCDNPYLYTLKTSLQTDGVERDCVETRVGVRTIEFSTEKGFLLNGRQVKMKGVNLHHDGGAVGAAVPARVWERRMELLKESGCNAIRTSHNVPSTEFLDLCDEQGLLVMDEMFDDWVNGKTKYGYALYCADWYERDIANTIRRDRNHPSVVMWSIGNELPDSGTPEGVMLAHKMIGLCHQLDHTRLVTNGCCNIAAEGNPTPEEFIAEFAKDIIGYNYPDRWRYRKETNYTEDKLAHPERLIVGTETSTVGDPRCPTGVPTFIWRDFPTYTGEGRNPMLDMEYPSSKYVDIEQRWKFALVNDYVIGDFMWTGFDYYGETRWPNRGACYGYMDNCGFKKDEFYMYQSIWTKTPVLHLVGGWTRGEENVGKIQQLVVFTNCTHVELFVNGKSYGAKRREFPRRGMTVGWPDTNPERYFPSTADAHLCWDVPYEPGEVKLVGLIDGKEEFVQTFQTAGAPASIRAYVDRDHIKAVKSDVAHVIVEILDKSGNVVPDADNLVKFSASGAEIIGVESGNLADLSSTKASKRKAYGGLCLAIVQTSKPGNYTVDVEVEGLGKQSVKFIAE